MPQNPRFVTIPTHDVMWFYDVDPNDPDPFLVGSPAAMVKWINDHVFAGTHYKFKGKPRVIFGDDKGGGFQIAGVVGTTMLVVSGFQSPLINAARFMGSGNTLRRSLTHSELTSYMAIMGATHDGTYAHSLALAEPQTSGAWDSFDAKLLGQPNRSGGIDFYIFEAEKQIYVHFELGSDRGFAADYFANLEEINDFVRWLVTDDMIPRTVYEVDAQGNVVPLGTLPSSNITISVDSNSTPEFANFDGNPPCLPPCVLRGVCSIVAGTMTTLDRGQVGVDGSATFNIEVVGLKPYCVDGTTGDLCA